MNASCDRARRRGSSQRGFTIIELMIVVCIVAILSMLAVPSMRDMIRIQRVKTGSFDIFAGLVLARSEAIKRNVSVTLTPGGADWSAGWTLTDVNGVVLARQDPLAGISVAGPGTLTFNSMGRATALATFAITSPDITSDKYRCIKVDLSGRPVSLVGICT